MRRLNRGLLGLFVLLGTIRAILYLIYVIYRFPTPLEAFHLEATMVNFAWRVQRGLPLYPDEAAYPYVVNNYGPLDFWCVGLLGRVLDADLDGLFRIGRAISFAAALVPGLVLGLFLGRRYGKGAGIAGAVLSLGASPMYGFSVMVRPDLPAQALGVAGFVLAMGRSRASLGAGVACLVLAFLAKQTAGAYLLAALLAMLWQGRARVALAFGGAYVLALALVLGALSLSIEPRIVQGLFGQAKTPWELEAWRRTVTRLCTLSPDLMVLSAAGLGLWLAVRPRRVEMAALAIIALTTGLVTAGKFGSDLNYFLDLRVIEALAVGTLWSLAREGRARHATGAILALGVASMLPGVWHAGQQALAARSDAGYWERPEGRAVLNEVRQVFRVAADPSVRILTDSPLLALHQGERGGFPDQILFRSKVNTGQIHPTRMIEQLESGYYDQLLLTSELDSPAYESYEFGLPGPLIEAARRRYRFLRKVPGFFVYVRRPEPVATPDRQAH